MLLLNKHIVAYLKIKCCLFYLYIMCIYLYNMYLFSHFFITKIKIINILNIRHTFFTLEGFVFYNRETSLAVMLKQLRRNRKNNMTKNHDKIVKFLKTKLRILPYHQPLAEGDQTQSLLEEVLVRPAGGAHSAVCVGPNAPVEWRGHYTVKKHCLLDETLNRGPDSLWSLIIPWNFP